MMRETNDPGRSRRVVAVYAGAAPRPEHERASQLEIARGLAALQSLDFAGEYDDAQIGAGPVYLVPAETIIGTGEAQRLGLHTQDDLFGGAVAYSFIATKAITHPLIGPTAQAPVGWSDGFASKVRDSVLDGFAAFSLNDVQGAGQRLLQKGPVRIKPVRAKAGRGQMTIHSTDELASALDRQDSAEIAEHGLVLEEHLDNVTTFSVGQVQVADLRVTYYGVQRLTNDNDGAEVYGGSDLVVVRGGFDDLLKLDLTDETRLAISQAQVYDAAAFEFFPGFFASRRNYDIARGIDRNGQQRSGVLEQSWRLGGASSAELAALRAFKAAPNLACIRASSLEAYGERAAVPAQATVLFQGKDNEVGFITKCAWVGQGTASDEQHSP